jgi:endonuclease/exonuclease/phosphatase family metal-dependent hydrolase
MSGCGEDVTDPSPSEPSAFELLSFGEDETLEVMTWNLQEFAKNYDVTVENVTGVLKALDVDIVALQEIQSITSFEEVVEGLDNRTGYRSSSAAYSINLAYVYRKDMTVKRIYEIYQDDWWSFPRPPLVMEIEWNGKRIIVINNHFKCCGSKEDRERRKSASQKLDAYVESYFDDEMVIIVGDLNDEIDDCEEDNVFWNFIEDGERYLFADNAISDLEYHFWSYPSWPSHLDHILITDELFDAYYDTTTEVTTFRISEFMQGGWYEYERDISDHQPVAMKLHFSE